MKIIKPTTNNKEYSNYKGSPSEEERYYKAKKKVEDIKGFYWNIITYICMVPMFIYTNLRFTPQFHWFWFPMLGWGIGILFHGLEVFGVTIFKDKGWEERKIRELMNDEEFINKSKNKWK